MEKLAKIYNTLSKIFDSTSCNSEKIVYKIKNKFYLIDEKAQSFKILCEMDSQQLKMIGLHSNDSLLLVKDERKYITQQKEHNAIFFDFELLVIDREEKIKNSFFKYCIREIDKENDFNYMQYCEETQEPESAQMIQEEKESEVILQELTTEQAQKEPLSVESEVAYNDNDTKTHNPKTHKHRIDLPCGNKKLIFINKKELQGAELEKSNFTKEAESVSVAQNSYNLYMSYFSHDFETAQTIRYNTKAVFLKREYRIIDDNKQRSPPLRKRSGNTRPPPTLRE